MKKVILLIGAALGLAQPAEAQFNGELDSTFAKDGISLIDYSQKSQHGITAKFHPNGKLYLGGFESGGPNVNLLLTVMNANGNADSTMGNDGAFQFDLTLGAGEFMQDMDILPNGKIVMVGTVTTGNQDQFITVVNPDGSYDTTFNQTGYLITGNANWDGWEKCLAEPNGKILVAGYQSDAQQRDVVMARYNANGTLDASFGIAGTFATDQGMLENVKALHRHSANIYYALVQKSDLAFYIMAFDGSGQLITGFGSGGIKSVTVGNSGLMDITHLTTDSQGNLYAMGTYLDKALVYKFSSSGAPDANYGVAGRYLANLSSSAYDAIMHGKVLPNGNLLLAGRTKTADYNFMTFMLATDGTLIFNYGPSGIQEYDLPNQNDEFNVKFTEDSNGKMYVYGTSDQGSNGRDLAVLKLKTGPTIGVNELAGPNAKIAFYPNPTTGLLSIDVSNLDGQTCEVQFYDLQGKLVHQLHHNSSEPLVSADLSALPAGVYLTRISNGNTVATFKVQKL